MAEKKILDSKTIDWPILLIYFIMILFGWFNIYSASYNEHAGSIFDLSKKYGKQFMFIIISIVLGGFILLADYRLFRAFAVLIYIVQILLIILVFFIGKEIGGNKNWIQIGSFSIQPAEFAKYGTALLLAKFLSNSDISLKNKQNLYYAIAIFLIPMALILAQKDTGSALVFFAFSIVLYREGLSGIWFVFAFIAIIIFILTLYFGPFWVAGVSLVIGLIVFYFIYKKKYLRIPVLLITGAIVLFSFSVNYILNNVLKETQKVRILVSLGLKDDPKGVGYNVMQSKIAIGSGGLIGKGYLQGTQTKLKYVPEQHTDFIFCTIGEEWGWIGSSTLIILYMFLIFRLYSLAEKQKSRFSRVYAYGVASILFFHFIINIGMTIGLIPVIGIPLPFFSYGGSSLMAFTVLLFTMLRIDITRSTEMSSLKDMY